jgi:hypothetical protein
LANTDAANAEQRKMLALNIIFFIIAKTYIIFYITKC